MWAFCPLGSRPPVLETSLLRQVMGAQDLTALVPSVTQGGCRTRLSMYLSYPGPNGWMVTALHGPAFLSRSRLQHRHGHYCHQAQGRCVTFI